MKKSIEKKYQLNLEKLSNDTLFQLWLKDSSERQIFERYPG
jgi:hypothetical protein